MDNLKELNTTEPVSVLGCKVPMSMKGQFIQLAAANKMNVNTQLAYMVQEFIQNGGKLDDGTKLKKAQDELTKLKAELEQVKKDAKKSDLAAQEALKQKKVVDDLQKELSALKAEKTTLSSKLIEANKTGINSITEGNKLHTQVTELTKEKTQLTKKIADLETTLKNEQKKFETLRENIDDFKALYEEKNKNMVIRFPSAVSEKLKDI